jgi:hypothetical protein
LFVWNRWGLDAGLEDSFGVWVTELRLLVGKRQCSDAGFVNSLGVVGVVGICVGGEGEMASMGKEGTKQEEQEAGHLASWRLGSDLTLAVSTLVFITVTCSMKSMTINFRKWWEQCNLMPFDSGYQTVWFTINVWKITCSYVKEIASTNILRMQIFGQKFASLKYLYLLFLLQ